MKVYQCTLPHIHKSQKNGEHGPHDQCHSGTPVEEMDEYWRRIKGLPIRDALMSMLRDSTYVGLFFPPRSSGAGDLIEDWLDRYRDQVLTEAAELIRRETEAGEICASLIDPAMQVEE